MYISNRTNRAVYLPPYHERIRRYEADKRREIPMCNSSAEVEDKLRELRERWKI